ncbi:MAG: T9SS type A sorting domain-containing protein [Bacteroidetes bacterium]|jgi:hypothetical protein|nr:T9SS type A sorting domain-containing protein [Bacteroidota bacterium]MBT5529697.1 T9SS type A sorting domain-containing protein [Cytophagia bacterium]MBT4338154.1 T9SS type A sorting domain-containing protein [Bacteroidota bacterium]MBT4727981.1 T9SS type A sorting domain-containing protein [Bacteroidota bacterium]MBT4967732.1 T9SS type A sorting domain-containing protein [Bacteroidota bacterium]
MQKLILVFICSLLSLYGIAQHDSCLQADFRFEGNVDDYSLKGVQAVNYGADAVEGYLGDANSAFHFNGQDEYIVLDNAFDYPNRSVSFWVYVEDKMETTIIFNNDNPSLLYGKNIINVNHDGTQYNIKYNVGKDGNQFNQAISLETWYFIAFTVDVNYVKYYFNGQEVYSGNMLYGTGSVDGDTNTRVGCGRKYDKFFKGSIDNFKVFGCSLTSAEVNHIYTSIKEQYVVQDQLNVYPNPVQDAFTIDFSASLQNQLSFELYNSLGQQVRNEALGMGNAKIYRKAEPNGVYFYKVFDSEQELIGSGKLIFK